MSRQARAWELSIGGWTQREIAQELGVSQAAVSRMLRRVGQEVARDLRRSTELHVARYAGQIDAFHREVSEAWEKSKSDQTRRRHRRVESPASGTGEAESTTMAEAVATSREGDPRFSAQMLKALQEKRAIFERIIGPESNDIAAPDPPADPDAEVKRKLARMSTDDLLLLRKVRQEKWNWSDAAREMFSGLTPEELIALAEIMKKDLSGDYDDPDDDDK
jgi:predicted transcriptional regulator